MAIGTWYFASRESFFLLVRNRSIDPALLGKSIFPSADEVNNNKLACSAKIKNRHFAKKGNSFSAAMAERAFIRRFCLVPSSSMINHDVKGCQDIYDIYEFYEFMKEGLETFIAYLLKKMLILKINLRR